MNKFCTNCGTQLTPNSNFCTGCGTKVASSKCPTCGQDWPTTGSLPNSTAPQANFQGNQGGWTNQPNIPTPGFNAPMQNFGRREVVYGNLFNAEVDCANCGAVFDPKTRVCPLCSVKN